MISELLVIGSMLGIYFQPEQMDNNWIPLLIMGLIGGSIRMLGK